jgi:N4-gp56 family major capsid protein
MALTTSTLATHVTAPVNFVLMRGLLSAAKRCAPYLNGTIAGELEENQGSKSVKWRRIANLAIKTTAISEFVGAASWQMGRDAVTPVVSDLTVAIAKYGNHINYTEELDLFNVNSRAAQLMDTLGENAGISINALMRDVMDSETTKRWASGAATTSATATVIDADDIRYAVNYLNRQSGMKFFPMGTGSQNVNTSTVRSSYFGICHPDVEEDIRQIGGFIGVEQYGGYTQVNVGEFGAVGGVRFASTEIAPINTSAGVTSVNGMRGAGTSTNDVYSTFIYARESVGSVGLGEEHTEDIYKGGDRIPAIELINKPVGSAGAGDPYNELGTIAWKAWFAGKVLNANWHVKVESCSADI